MKKILLLILVISLCGCEEQPSYIKGKSQKSDNDGINYFKDERTGLCFAERGYVDTYTFTCVPCTEEVQNLIKQ